MFRTSGRRFARITAASLAATLAASAFGPIAAATAAVAPAIERDLPAPTPNSEPDPFYTPPASIPSGNPGDVIRARPANAGPPTARSLANAWQVMYLSTNALGEPNVVTGTIMVPKGADPADTPVVAMAPGTTGPAFRCTVSRFVHSGAFYEQPAVNDMLKAGYAVALTDYEGYYENPKTTYLAGRSMGAAVLNSVRAATRLPEAGLSATPKVLVRGYSQGGGATMWAGQMAAEYAPELNLVGIAAGGVPANLASVATGLEGKPGFGFFLNELIGLDNAYSELDFASYQNDLGRETITKMEANDCTLELLLDYQNRSIKEYTTTTPLATLTWRNRVDPENRLGLGTITVPVFQYHANNDPIVVPGQARTLRSTYCAKGVNLQWKEFDGTGHVTTVARGNADVNAFLAARVAGQAPTPNCPTT